MQIIDPSLEYLIGPPPPTPSTPTADRTYIASNSNFNLILIQQDNNTLAGASSALRFRFKRSNLFPADTTPTHWNICTNITLGEFCMDQWGNNASQPALQAPGNFTGQQWTMIPDKSTSPTQWQMQSYFAGPLDFLSAYGAGVDSLAMSSDAPAADTWFELVKVSSAESAATSSSALSTSTMTWRPSSGAATTVPDSPAVSGSSAPSASQQVVSRHSLSGGAIAGLTVGIIALVGIVAAAVLIWCARKRRWRRNNGPRAELDSRSQMTTPATKASLLGPTTVGQGGSTSVSSSSGAAESASRQFEQVHEMPTPESTEQNYGIMRQPAQTEY